MNEIINSLTDTQLSSIKTTSIRKLLLNSYLHPPTEQELILLADIPTIGANLISTAIINALQSTNRDISSISKELLNDALYTHIAKNTSDPLALPRISYLLQQGADINHTHPAYPNLTVLHRAALFDNDKILQHLITFPTPPNLPPLDINPTDIHGDTPLIIAAKYSLINNVTILIKSGADETIRNKDNRTYEDYINPGFLPIISTIKSTIKSTLTSTLTSTKLHHLEQENAALRAKLAAIKTALTD